MITVPVLETARLRLRAHRPDDLDAAVSIWQNPDVYAYITRKSLTRSDVWLRLLRYGGLWDFLGYGYWAVEERAGGRYIGQMGFADFKRGLIGFDGHYPEAGWVIDPAYAGRGYATEGMLAACRWLDDSQLYRRSYCLIGSGNDRSVTVARKLGYSYALEVSLGGEVVDVYTRDSAQEEHQDESDKSQ